MKDSDELFIIKLDMLRRNGSKVIVYYKTDGQGYIWKGPAVVICRDGTLVFLNHHGEEKQSDSSGRLQETKEPIRKVVTRISGHVDVPLRQETQPLSGEDH